MVCMSVQGCGKTMFTLTEETGCVWCASHHSIFDCPLTAILEPDMQVFFSKLRPCLTFLLGGFFRSCFSHRSSILTNRICMNRTLSVGPQDISLP